MTIKELIPVYLAHLRITGRAERTIKNTRYSLNDFVRFLDGEEILNIEDITAEVMLAYQEDLAFRLTAGGKLLAIRSQDKPLSVARGFARYAHEQDYLVSDPGKKIKPPRKPKTLPRGIMSQQEVKKVIDATDMHESRGYRNRIVLEILYDTAIRRQEICNIKISDIDLDEGEVAEPEAIDGPQLSPVPAVTDAGVPLVSLRRSTHLDNGRLVTDGKPQR